MVLAICTWLQRSHTKWPFWCNPRLLSIHLWPLSGAHANLWIPTPHCLLWGIKALHQTPLSCSFLHCLAPLRGLGPPPVNLGKRFIGASMPHDLRLLYYLGASIASSLPPPRFRPWRRKQGQMHMVFNQLVSFFPTTMGTGRGRLCFLLPVWKGLPLHHRLLPEGH